MNQFEVPDDLKTAGNDLWCGVSAGRTLNAANMVLLHNACRIADRLDALSAEIGGRLTSENSLGTEVINPLISEHRQQFAALNTILARMGVGELAKASKQTATVDDQMAAKRAERAARTAG